MKTYELYLCIHNCDTVLYEKFETREEALGYIERDLKDRMLVDEDHRCSDSVYNSGAVAHYELYDGSPEIHDEDGEVVDWAEPIFESKAFYHD